MGGDGGAESGAEGGFAGHHAILEDDAADDDGDGGGELADEAEGCGRGCDISRLDEGLEGYEGGLEIGAYAEAGDDLVGYDAAPGAGVGEIDKESEADGHEEDAEVDGGKVLACFFDEDADDDGGKGEGEDEGEEVDAGEDWGGAENGLEVEGVEVGAGDEDEAVDEADAEGGEVGAFGEEPERHHGVFGEFPFVEKEEDDGYETEY